MFQTPHAVQWIRPEAQEGCDVPDWFNILVLHQNRIKMNPKNAINEHFLPRFLDFIVWGHEHECLVDPQEVSGMGFHITQPGSSVATSLIEGEAKPKHVLLLEIKGSQYRPTKIPLKSVRPFEYAEVVLKDEADIDPNDQASVLEHLDKVVKSLIDKASKKAVDRSELKLPLVRIKVDYSGFMTINPQRFGQKYVGKVANPQDILIFSKVTKKHSSTAGKIDDSERLRPEELNQQNIEALVAESNLKMEILPVNDLDVALHDFVNKDDKMAFYSCLQYNLEETRNKITKESDTLTVEENDLILKVEQCMQERVKERLQRSKESRSSSQILQELKGKSQAGLGSSNSFSDEEDTTQLLSSSKSTGRGRKGKGTSRSSNDPSEQSSGRASRRGRGRGPSSLKQTTLDATLRIRQSERSASAAASTAVRSIADAEDNVGSASSDESDRYEINEVVENSEPEQSLQSKGRKRPARGRGRGSQAPVKRGKKSDNSLIHSMFMNKDDDDDDDDDASNRLKKTQPRVTRNYGSLLRKK